MANKRWVTDGKRYELLFAPFYEEECVLSFCQDKDDPTCFWYVSDEMNVEYDCEFADNIEEAKELFEVKFGDHLNDLVSYHETVLDAWMEDEEDGN